MHIHNLLVSSTTLISYFKGTVRCTPGVFLGTFPSKTEQNGLYHSLFLSVYILVKIFGEKTDQKQQSYRCFHSHLDVNLTINYKDNVTALHWKVFMVFNKLEMEILFLRQKFRPHIVFPIYEGSWNPSPIPPPPNSTGPWSNFFLSIFTGFAHTWALHRGVLTWKFTPPPLPGNGGGGGGFWLPVFTLLTTCRLGTSN